MCVCEQETGRNSSTVWQPPRVNVITRQRVVGGVDGRGWGGYKTQGTIDLPSSSVGQGHYLQAYVPLVYVSRVVSTRIDAPICHLCDVIERNQ